MPERSRMVKAGDFDSCPEGLEISRAGSCLLKTPSFPLLSYNHPHSPLDNRCIGFSPTPNNSRVPAGCPAVQSDTAYLEVASDPTG